MPIGLKGNNDGSGAIQIGGSDAITISTGLNTTFAGTVTSAGLVAGATGALYPIVSGTAVASTSGTSIDFTNIPSWVKRITVMFNGVSITSISDLLIQLGDSGGVETSGYVGANQTNGAGTVAFSSGFDVFTFGTAAQAANGSAILTLLDATTSTWSIQSILCDGGGSRQVIAGGIKPLSPGALTTVRITSVLGTPTFDAGSINILYE